MRLLRTTIYGMKFFKTTLIVFPILNTLFLSLLKYPTYEFLTSIFGRIEILWPFILLASWVFFFVFWGISLIYPFINLKKKNLHLISKLMPVLANLVTTLFLFLPMEKIYVNLNHHLFNQNRVKFIGTIENKETYTQLEPGRHYIAAHSGYVSLHNHVGVDMGSHQVNWIFFATYSSFFGINGFLYVPKGQNCSQMTHIEGNFITHEIQYSEQCCYISYGGGFGARI